MVLPMGKGLSPLQHDVLAVLDGYAPFERQPPGNLSGWARPKHILIALGRSPTPSNRVVLSKVLLGLWRRGLVARANSEIAIVGKSFRYVRITDRSNAGAGNGGPILVMGRPKPKMHTVVPLKKR